MPRSRARLVGDRAVVPDSTDEGSLTALAPERWQGAPDRKRDVLHQIFTIARIALVRGGEPPQNRNMLGKQPSEPRIERFAHSEADRWKADARVTLQNSLRTAGFVSFPVCVGHHVMSRSAAGLSLMSRSREISCVAFDRSVRRFVVQL